MKMEIQDMVIYCTYVKVKGHHELSKEENVGGASYSVLNKCARRRALGEASQEKWGR